MIFIGGTDKKSNLKKETWLLIKQISFKKNCTSSTSNWYVYYLPQKPGLEEEP